MVPRVRMILRGLFAGALALVLAQSVVPTAAAPTATGAATSAGAAMSVAPATAADPAATAPARRRAGKISWLRPNLVVLPAADVHVQRTPKGRRLRFESALGNIGRGPIEVRPRGRADCPPGKHLAVQAIYKDMDGSGRFHRKHDDRIAARRAGCMVFHRRHDHWHFEAASRYVLFRRDQPRRRTVARRKMSFCLRDSRELPESYKVHRYPERYGACSQKEPQGISIGWVDVYQSFLAGQSLRLPKGAGNGLYCLRIQVDPRDALIESDDDDNGSVRAFFLNGDRVRYRKASKCDR